MVTKLFDSQIETTKSEAQVALCSSEKSDLLYTRPDPNPEHQMTDVTTTEYATVPSLLSYDNASN